MSLNVFGSVSELIRKLNVYFSNNEIDIVIRDFSISSLGECHITVINQTILILEIKNCEIIIWNIQNVPQPTIELLTNL